jgi:hypothetical protein
VATLNTTTYAYALKRLYNQKRIFNLAYKSNPFLAMVPKSTNFVGAAKAVATLYGNAPGISAGFASAQGNVAASAGEQFLVTRVKHYGLASIDTETILASKGSEGALLSATKREMDSVIAGMGNDLGKAIYGDGSGSIGTLNGNPSSNVYTLASAGDITNFEVGMSVIFADSITSAARDSGTAATISALDRDAGTFTCGSTPTGTVDGDLVFREGDYTAAGSSTLKISGLAKWIASPAEVTAGVGALFGVTRTSDVTRLAGIRVDGTSLNLEEALKAACARASREGATPDYAFMSFEQFNALTNLLGSKVQYSDHKVGEIGFQGVKVISPSGVLTCIPDRNCPNDIVYVVQMNTWELASLGPAPQILDLDGDKWSREGSADAWEVRFAMFGNLCCGAPGYNVRLAVNAV